MYEVEVITDNNERKLVREIGLFEEVHNLLRVVELEVALPTDVFHFTNLASPCSGSLNVLEVNLGIFTEIVEQLMCWM
jgi:hypothetical protein